MDKQSTTDSNISLDSLENNLNSKTTKNQRKSEENVDTILVPFYENDVLIKVPKDLKRNTHNVAKTYKSNKKDKKEVIQANTYLINKCKSNLKRTTYLEIFRKQFGPNEVENKTDKHEIRSLSPEFGDTERESIDDDINNSATEFFNTESYNEMYYEKLLTRDIQMYLDNSVEGELEFSENLHLKSPLRDPSPDVLKSVSEVSNPRRQRRVTVEPIRGFKLGGLGPDMEKIKPRLERARSLQRYSEKVRMENRLKIYKKGVQAENYKKNEREQSAKRQNSGKEVRDRQNDTAASYLVNKAVSEKQATFKSVYQKSKSADMQRTRETNTEKEQRQKQLPTTKRSENTKSDKLKIENKTESTARSSRNATKIKTECKNMGINTDDADVAPVQINFMVNVGGARTSSALKTLEEKHRMYQEQVKAFMDTKNG